MVDTVYLNEATTPDASDPNGSGTPVVLTAGNGNGLGTGGAAQLKSGQGGVTGPGGATEIRGGFGGTTSGNGGQCWYTGITY